MLLWMVGAALLAPQVLASPTPPRPAAAAGYHVVFLRLGPKWVREVPPGQQVGIQEHGQYLSSLSSEGTLVLGGPFLDDGAATASGAMVVFAVADAAQARRLMEADPGVKAGLLEIAEVKRLLVATGSWRPWSKPQP